MQYIVVLNEKERVFQEKEKDKDRTTGLVVRTYRRIKTRTRLPLPLTTPSKRDVLERNRRREQRPTRAAGGARDPDAEYGPYMN